MNSLQIQQNERLNEEVKRLKEALGENIHYCRVVEEEKACFEIATWHIADYTWSEYLCDKHKNTSICKAKPILVPRLVRAKQALKGEVK